MRVGIVGTGVTFDHHLKMASLSEEMRFDAFFLPEHHQEPYWPSAPLITLAAIASRTDRIRLGTAIAVMGLHNPVRLAEEVATLDQISGGRVTLGLGLGYQQKDFAALGVPRRLRLPLLEEGVEILRRAWTERPFTFHGRTFAFEGVSVYPGPVQQPHPPIWMGAWTLAGVRRAGRISDGWITDPLHGLDAILTLAQEYRRAARAAGRRPYVVLMRQVATAADAETARAVFGPTVLGIWHYYWRSRSFDRSLEPQWEDIDDPATIDLQMVLPDRVPFGSPSECIRDLHRWLAALSPDYVIVVPTPNPGAPEALFDQVSRLGLQVLPALSSG